MIRLTREDIIKIHNIKYNLLMFDISLFQEACIDAGITYNL